MPTDPATKYLRSHGIMPTKNEVRQKAVRVVNSCKTIPQLNMAMQYWWQVNKIYPPLWFFGVCIDGHIVDYMQRLIKAKQEELQCR